MIKVMIDDRQYEEEDKEATEDFVSDEVEEGYEPECSASEEERNASDIECEFEKRDGGWWCTSHNCWA